MTPDWMPALLMAEAWGMPPWLIEGQVSAAWTDRFLLLASARAERDNPKKLV